MTTTKLSEAEEEYNAKLKAVEEKAAKDILQAEKKAKQQIKIAKEKELYAMKQQKDEIQSLSLRIWNYLVNLVALFMAQVLQHPSVKKAAADVMVAGIDEAMAQPDLIQRMANITKSAAASKVMGNITVQEKLDKNFHTSLLNSLVGHFRL